MWITVLVLAIAMNFEPSRPVWVPLMLARPRPILQLFSLFCGTFLSGLAAGLLVLFVFRQTPFSSDPHTAALVQIGVGVTGLLLAAVMATNVSLPGRKAKVPADTAGAGASAGDGAEVTAVDKMSDRARAILRKGNSPWLSAGIGVAIGVPSLEYLAALVVIASSGVGKPAEIAALLMFLLVGNLLITLPLATYVFAPRWTAAWIERFQTWLRARGRREFAAILAGIGLLQIAIGVGRL